LPEKEDLPLLFSKTEGRKSAKFELHSQEGRIRAGNQKVQQEEERLANFFSGDVLTGWRKVKTMI